MDLEKQRIMLSCLSASRELMALTAGMIKPSYFDPSLRKSVKFMKEYFEKYRDVPNIAIIKAQTGTALEDLPGITQAETKFVAEELEGFCKVRAALQAVIDGPALIEKGDYATLIQSLKDATAVGLQKDLGLDYFADPRARLEQTLQTQARISTGIPELDDALGGGLARQELITFLANSGGGKSMTMLNICHNLLAQGLNGVYISLEMAEGVVSKRLDSMMTHVSQNELLKSIAEVSSKIVSLSDMFGQFRIKRFPEGRTTVNDVRSWLQQLEQATGFRPDFICIDYIDIMGTSSGVKTDNMFIKDKYVTEEIRGLGFDYDCIMISASQLGRNAIDAEDLNQSHIQGGMSKINTSDYAVAIRQDDLMRAAGEIWLQILKSRNSNGVGRKILLMWDAISLKIKSRKAAELNFRKSPPSAPQISIIPGKKPPDKGGAILNLFDEP